MIRFVIFKFLHEESRVVRLTGFGIPDLPSDLRQHREAMLPDYKSDKGETLGNSSQWRGSLSLSQRDASSF